MYKRALELVNSVDGIDSVVAATVLEKMGSVQRVSVHDTCADHPCASYMPMFLTICKDTALGPKGVLQMGSVCCI